MSPFLSTRTHTHSVSFFLFVGFCFFLYIGDFSYSVYDTTIYLYDSRMRDRVRSREFVSPA